jgi:cell fate regulator YaaT (PSP1 superfamily)
VALICAVVFQRQGRLYYADPGELTLNVGAQVLYPTDAGPEVAEVVWAPQWVDDDIGGLPVLAAVADQRDLDAATVSRKKRAAARVAAKRLIREHDLPMKLSGVDYVADDNRTTVYFTAPHRIDFRALVRDLSATLNGRVELRQLSARDEARLTGGVGSCGRELCCSTFLVDFEPVSVRMAKAQDLPLNPMRISGACGRLMCCLKYEHPLYQDFADEAPALGESIDTPEGAAIVVGHDVPGQRVVVRMAADGRRSACALASVCSSRVAYEASSGAERVHEAGLGAERVHEASSGAERVHEARSDTGSDAS